ncbi:MAG: DNA primase [Fimbriimonadaceae bacterium]
MAADFDRIKDEIRRRSDIVELVGQRVSLKKKGRYWEGLCPFHDDRNPSFRVTPDYGYKCWSCGAKGDCFNWVMETQRVDFMEAMRILAQSAGIDIPEFQSRDKGENEQMELAMAEGLAFYREELRGDKFASEYVVERGLDQATIDAWELGYGPSAGEVLATRLKKKGFSLALCQKLFLIDQDQSGGFYDRFRGRLMFPIRDERGKLVAFGGRIIGQGQPKYINSSDTPIYSKSRVLYGMHKAKETIAKLEEAVLVEGYMDVIACHRAGVTNAVASLGTALADEHVRLLKRWCNRVVVLYDADDAGKKAADRAAILLTEGGLKVKIALAPPGGDPDTLLKDKGSQAVRQIVEQGLTPMEFRMAQLNDRLRPEDDAYWEQVVQVLATAETPLELQKYLFPVAAKYPGIRDRQAATKALERMVAEARKKRKANARVEPLREDVEVGGSVEPATILPQVSDLIGAEKVIFMSLFTPGLREKAWPFASHEPLMKSVVGRQLALALKALKKVPKSGSDWVYQVLDEGAQSVLIELGIGDLEPIELEVLEDAVERLSKQLESREARSEAEKLLEGGADDDALRNINARLSKLKGGENK